MSGQGRLEGRVAVITGAASGIGEGTVRRFIQEGAKVIIADVQDAPGAALAKELGCATRFVHTDFTSLLTADVETPIMALHRCRGDDGEFFERFGGRYFDHFECRDGDWRIAHRKLTQDWDTKELVEPAFVPNRFHPSPRL